MWDLAFHSKKPRKPQKTKALSDYGESMGPCSLRKVRFFLVFLVSSNGMLGFMCGPWAVSVFVVFLNETYEVSHLVLLVHTAIVKPGQHG